MSSEKPRQFPELLRPPIVEVVCGVVFESVPNLDALLLGVYWDRRKADFPQRQLQPALSDELGFSFGAMPLRAFLVSADEQFILQLQHDRFFMNWRARGAEYPRFSERHGRDGLLTRMEKELGRFDEFVKERCGVVLAPKRVELSKIDLLERGKHWETADQQAKLLPVTGVFEDVQRTDTRDVNLRFVERGAGGVVFMHIATLSDGERPTAIRIDSRFVTEPTPSIREAFYRGNEVLNDAFFKLVSDATGRFGSKGNEHAG